MNAATFQRRCYVRCHCTVHLKPFLAPLFAFILSRTAHTLAILAFVALLLRLLAASVQGKLARGVCDRVRPRGHCAKGPRTSERKACWDSWLVSFVCETGTPVPRKSHVSAFMLRKRMCHRRSSRETSRRGWLPHWRLASAVAVKIFYLDAKLEKKKDILIRTWTDMVGSSRISLSTRCPLSVLSVDFAATTQAFNVRCEARALKLANGTSMRGMTSVSTWTPHGGRF